MHTTTPVWQGQAALTCLARHEETADCASFTLTVPAGTRLAFLPGQFVCLGAEIDAQLQLRAYSIASSADEHQRFTVAIRRVPGGKVSNHLLDTLRPGHSVLAQAPAGDFHFDPARLAAPAAPRHLALFSAGCGITPMMAIARTVLTHTSEVDIHFFHSAHDEANFIFARQVRALAATHPRFHLHASLSSSCGRLNAATLRAALPAETEATLAYLCGPDAYMDMVREALRAHGLPASAIHSERFFIPAPLAAQPPTGSARHSINVPAFGKSLSTEPGESLLEALEREGLPIIGACRSGACGACRCKLVAGQAHSTTTGPLDEAAQEAGYVLACCTYPESDLSVELG